jgi:hypothetical protein
VTQAQVHLYTVVDWALLLLDSAVGVAILVVRWHRATAARRPQPAPLEATPPASGDPARGWTRMVEG